MKAPEETHWNRTALRIAEVPGPALLAAGGFSQAVGARLSPEGTQLYEAFHQEMCDWFERQEPAAIVTIYKTWWPRLMAHYEQKAEHNDSQHPAQIALATAYLQVRAVLPTLSARVLPGDGFYDMGPEHFAQFGAQCAQVQGSSLEIYCLRLETLLLNGTRSWGEQQSWARRMGWAHPIDAQAFPAHQRAAVTTLACGAPAEWIREAPEGALLLHVTDANASKLTTRLQAEDLKRFGPWRPHAEDAELER